MSDSNKKAVKTNRQKPNQMMEQVKARRKTIQGFRKVTAAILQKWWESPCIKYAFSHPHVRSRLERLMGTNLVRLTDKGYMQELQDRIRTTNEEDLQKRVQARELAERERLKWLILSGKTPLSDCPPELYHHPVFAFWRVVNKEVESASKKRAEAFMRQQRRRAGQVAPAEAPEDATAAASESPSDLSERSLSRTESQAMRREMELVHEEEMMEGYRFTDEEFAALKYESPDVKIMRMLKSVEELYEMADSIIGSGAQQQMVAT